MRPDRRVRRYVFNDGERCIAGRCIGGRCPCLCHVESPRLARYNRHLVRRRGRLGTLRGLCPALLSGWCDVCVTRSAQDCSRIAHTPNRGTLETVEQSINFRERRMTSLAWRLDSGSEIRQFVPFMTGCRACVALERSARGVSDGVSSLVGWHLHCDLRVACIIDGVEKANNRGGGQAPIVPTYYVSLSVTRPASLRDPALIRVFLQAVERAKCVPVEISTAGMVIETDPAVSFEVLEASLRDLLREHGAKLDGISFARI